MAPALARCLTLLSGVTPAQTRSVIFLSRARCDYRICGALDWETSGRWQALRLPVIPEALTVVAPYARMEKTRRQVIGRWRESFSSAHFRRTRMDFQNR